MTASIDDVLHDARVILMDTDPDNYRRSTSELVRLYNSALREARRLRPDLFIGQYGVALSTQTPSDTTDYTAVNFPLPEWVMPAFASYIAGRAELADDEYADDGRSAALLKEFVITLRTDM